MIKVDSISIFTTILILILVRKNNKMHY